MPRRASFDTTISVPTHHDPDQSDTIEVEVIVEYTFTPGSPGVYDGPIDGSYPPEPAEVEILSVVGDDKEYNYDLDLSDSDQERLYDEAMEDSANLDESDGD